jgi:hypothetical protein
MSGIWSLAVPLALLACLSLIGAGMIVVMRNGERRRREPDGDPRPAGGG